MDWQTLLHDKRFLYAGGVVAAIGAGVFYARRSKTSSSSTTTTPAATTTGSSTGSLGQFDSTGTDVANWLGNQSGALQNQLDQFAQEQKDTNASLIDAIKHLNTPTPAPTPAPAPSPSNPAPAAPAAPASRYVPVVKFTSRSPAWNSTLSGIAGHEHTTVANLLRLNPKVKNANLIYAGQQIRVA